MFERRTFFVSSEGRRWRTSVEVKGAEGETGRTERVEVKKGLGATDVNGAQADACGINISSRIGGLAGASTASFLDAAFLAYDRLARMMTRRKRRRRERRDGQHGAGIDDDGHYAAAVA